MKTNFFQLTWKKFSISAIVFIAFFFFRNLWWRWTGINGKVFSNTVTIIIPLYLIICVIYSLKNKNKTKKKIKKEKIKQKSKKQSIFLLSWKKLGLTLIAWVVAVVIHNLGSAIIGFEEPVFFFIAIIVIPVYLIICSIYSLVKLGKKK